MDIIWILAQIMGVCGILVFVLMFQFKTMESVLKMKMLMDVLWGLHYLLIGGMSAFAINMICLVREIIFLRNNRKNVSAKAWLWIFIVFNLVSAIITWKGAYCILPALVSSLATYSFWQKNVKTARIIGLSNNVMMFTYDIFVKSFMGMIGESLAFISVIISIYRYRRVKTNK